ncbi:unnamed protein product [Caenorhabditis sp. 36 PRJEB53466]|nr:unnamed protein product [Caenorhabditis sp. 36 PRJEB53466]
MEGRKRRRRGHNFSTFFRLSGEKTEPDDSSESEGDHEEILDSRNSRKTTRERKRESYVSRSGRFIVAAPAYWSSGSTDQSTICWTDPTDNNIEHHDETPRLGTCSQFIRDSQNTYPAISAEYTGEPVTRGVYGYGAQSHFDRNEPSSSIPTNSEKNPISEEIETFLVKNAYKFTGPKIIGETDVMNPDAQHQKVSNLSAKNCEEFRDVGGAVYNVTGVFHYPREPPFSGEQISLLGINASNQPAHIRLKTMIFHVLSRSCTQQRDIQSVTWILPNEKNSKGPNRRDFPDELYVTLRDLFLQFFGLDYGELDAPYRNEFSTLKCLQSFGDDNSKKKLFKFLAHTRNSYLTTTFRTALKEALIELRHGTFLPPVIGQQYGRFVYRKRHTATTSKSVTHHLIPYQLTAQGTEETERQEVHDTNVAVLTETPTTADDLDQIGETLVLKEDSLSKKNKGKSSRRRRHNSQKDTEEETDGQAAPAKRANLRRNRRNI